MILYFDYNYCIICSDDDDNSDDDDGSDSTSIEDENLVLWSDICGQNDQSNDDFEIPPVLLKRKPNYQWNPVKGKPIFV